MPPLARPRCFTEALLVLDAALLASPGTVRETRRWLAQKLGRLQPFYGRVHTGMHGPARISLANLTPLSPGQRQIDIVYL